MFITNKLVKLSKEIYIDGVYVKVAGSFTLLGDIIDNKLNFSEQCLNIKKLVNRKLYRIKRLLYLSTTVKIPRF